MQFYLIKLQKSKFSYDTSNTVLPPLFVLISSRSFQ